MGLGACCGAQAEVRTLGLCARGPGRGRGGSGRVGAGARVWGPYSRGAAAELFLSVTGLSPLPVRASAGADMTAPGRSPFVPLLETLEDSSASHGEQTDAYLTLTR